MPWTPKIKRELMARCGRYCCVCGKFCDVNIEIDHIVPESEGGPSTEDNGIPVCFDCHARIKNYNDDHPRGTKFTPEELRLHRDRMYYLVKSGAIYRRRALHESATLPEQDDGKWSKTQTSTICSYDFPFPVPEHDGEVDTNITNRLFQRLQHIIGLAYWVTATTTPYDDFVYLLSFEPTDVLSEGYRVFRTELHCHLTTFVRMFQAKCEQELEQKDVEIPNEIQNAPDDLELMMNAQRGRFVPYRISRHGAKSIWLRELISRPYQSPPVGTTSGLMALLHGVLNNKTIIWDDFEWTDDTKRVMNFMAVIADSGTFSFDQIALDRSDPERWKAPGVEK